MWRPCAFNGTRVYCEPSNRWCKLSNVPANNGNAPINVNGKLVVCIEDEQEMIDLVQLILGRRGFTVEGANGGLEGLEKVQKRKPDLVLLDLMMPDMDGWEVYQRMKSDEELRDIPVIVITAKAQSIDKVLGLHIAKVDDYITKPFGPQELLESVEKILGQAD